MKLNDSKLFRQQALINGEWLDANNGEVIDVTNPANGDKLGSVPKMGADETRAAIDAANRALPAWRALTAKERANILRNWFNLLMEHQDDLARLMTLEQGKPLAEAKGEISYAASFIEWFAEEGKRIYGDTIPGHQADKRLIVIKQPIGVTAAITPWNFPAAMITRKAGPALAAGCTMVLKPASQTPFSALALAELAIRAGIPAGVFNVVTGSAGAAVLLAYLFAGLLVVMIMRMLAEMAVATPDTGSFSTYADKAIGRWAGYTIGWLYWWFWVLVIPLEANIAAMILHSWGPGIPIWLFSLVITLALTGSNLLSVKNYGEFEFWLALCKVIAILAFIFLGAVAISGFYPYAEVSGISRLWDSGGFMPNGFGAVLSAMLITMFSFMGAEIVTIAAAESDTPEKHIVRATNSVIWRISIFYLCSIFVVVALIPWNMPGLKAVGSYRSVLELLNIPHAKLIMDCVILLSVTSCLNSALYTASRMLYSLSRRGDAPAVMGKINRSKTPYVAVLLSTGAAFLTVVVNYYAPAKVFKFLIDSSGAIALLVYLVIAVSQLRMRKILRAEGSEIRLRMWLYPWLTWLVIGFITFVLVVMLFRPAQQLEVISTGLLAIGIICTVPIMARWKKLVLWQKTPVHNTR